MVNGIQALEVRIGLAGGDVQFVDLTDEDKAVNAATYAKLVAGGEYLVYTDELGIRLYSSALVYPTEDAPGTMFSFESEVLSYFDYPKIIMNMDSTGEVFIDKIVDLITIKTGEPIYSEEVVDGVTKITLTGYTLTDAEKLHNKNMYEIIRYSAWGLSIILDMTGIIGAPCGIPTGYIFQEDFGVILTDDLIMQTDAILLKADGSLEVES